MGVVDDFDGLHPFGDPDVAENFATTRLAIAVTEFHTYAVDWTAEAA